MESVASTQNMHNVKLAFFGCKCIARDLKHAGVLLKPRVAFAPIVSVLHEAD